MRHMVRRLAGAAIAIGRGTLPVSFIEDTLRESAVAVAAPWEPREPEGDEEEGASSSGGKKKKKKKSEMPVLPYVVAPGRGLWLERTFLPDPRDDEAFWTGHC